MCQIWEEFNIELMDQIRDHLQMLHFQHKPDIWSKVKVCISSELWKAHWVVFTNNRKQWPLVLVVSQLLVSSLFIWTNVALSLSEEMKIGQTHTQYWSLIKSSSLSLTYIRESYFQCYTTGSNVSLVLLMKFHVL